MEMLLTAGTKGASVKAISRYVYNSCNSLFMPLDYEDVHRYVADYLRHSSRKLQSVVERMAGRGWYRLNPNSTDALQFKLVFSETDDVKEEENADGPDSLSLF